MKKKDRLSKKELLFKKKVSDVERVLCGEISREEWMNGMKKEELERMRKWCRENPSEIGEILFGGEEYRIVKV